MTINDLEQHCMNKPGVTEETPFGPDTLVFKVMNKMFALADIKKFESINVKCDPEYAIELRERHPEVQPGYHMNKKHWNTVVVNEGVTDKEILKWVDDSYDLIVKSLPKKVREELENR